MMSLDLGHKEIDAAVICRRLKVMVQTLAFSAYIKEITVSISKYEKLEALKCSG